MSAGRSLGLAALVAACSDPPTAPPPEPLEFATFAATPGRQLDILFVIDNSNSPTGQFELIPELGAFVDVATAVDGALPDLHIGVTSSDEGVYGQPISNCEGDGDNGLLQNAARIPDCVPPVGRFIDTGTVNYTAPLAETFYCIAALGVAGCGFEQHLEAMRRALDGRNPENEGFRRPRGPAVRSPPWRRRRLLWDRTRPLHAGRVRPIHRTSKVVPLHPARPPLRRRAPRPHGRPARGRCP